MVAKASCCLPERRVIEVIEAEPFRSTETMPGAIPAEVIQKFG